MKPEYSRQILENIEIKNLMKILPMGGSVPCGLI
jgi:hypothetical protein